MAISRLLARPLLASVFAYAGVNAVKDPEPLIGRARRITDKVGPAVKDRGVPLPEDTATLVRVNGAVQVTAAVALAMGKLPRLSAALLAGSLVPTTLAGHPFWDETDPQARAQHRLQFAKNCSLLGGLMLAVMDTEGKPGVAWRARHAAKDARRSARALAREAKLEAKLAAKAVA